MLDVLFRVELISSSFLDLVSKQARLMIAVRTFLFSHKSRTQHFVWFLNYIDVVYHPNLVAVENNNGWFLYNNYNTSMLKVFFFNVVDDDDDDDDDGDDDGDDEMITMKNQMVIINDNDDLDVDCGSP